MKDMKEKLRGTENRMSKFKLHLIVAVVPEIIEMILSYQQFKYTLAKNFLELMKGMNSQFQAAG